MPFTDLAIFYAAGLLLLAAADMARRVLGIGLPHIDGPGARLLLAAIVPLAFGFGAEHAARPTLVADATGQAWAPVALKSLAADALAPGAAEDQPDRIAGPQTGAPIALEFDRARVTELKDVPGLRFSGLARFDKETLIGVTDNKDIFDLIKKGEKATFAETKGLSEKFLFLISETDDKFFPSRPIPLSAMVEFEGELLPGDLESVCVLSVIERTVLVAESSYDRKDATPASKFGRLFRIEMDQAGSVAEVTGIARLGPKAYAELPEDVKKKRPQFEGMICRQDGARVRVIMAQRGSLEDSTGDVPGMLSAFNVAFSNTAVVDPEPVAEVPIAGPPRPECTPEDAAWRAASELHHDKGRQRLLGVSTYEGKDKDTGKFCSAVYDIKFESKSGGALCKATPSDPFAISKHCVAKAILHHFPSDKIEGLTAGAVSTDNEGTNEFIGRLEPAKPD